MPVASRRFPCAATSAAFVVSFRWQCQVLPAVPKPVFGCPGGQGSKSQHEHGGRCLAASFCIVVNCLLVAAGFVFIGPRVAPIRAVPFGQRHSLPFTSLGCAPAVYSVDILCRCCFLCGISLVPRFYYGVLSVFHLCCGVLSVCFYLWEARCSQVHVDLT